jgi:hypothetical protein
MRRSLFDELRQPTQIPRLRPNLFARTAQFAMHNASAVILAALFMAALMAWPGYSNFPATFRLDFLGGGQAGKNWSRLQRDFPGIESLATLAVAHGDGVKLKQIREETVAKLKGRTDLFQQVLALGSGDYYTTYGVFYRKPAELDARVAYALSLRPLFQAVAAAPRGDSLATLVNEVAAAIEQGRDPQGLDILFTEAAASVKALLAGEDRSVDWLAVAGLSFNENAQAGMILVWPKPGNVTAANAMIDSVADELRADPAVSVVVQKAPDELKAYARTGSEHRTLVVMGFSFLLIAMVLFALLGQIRLVFITLAPAGLASIAAAASLAYFVPAEWIGFWPVLMSAGAIGLVLGLRFTFASLEPLAQRRGIVTAVMLAAQKQGPGILLLAIACVLPWCAWALADDARIIATIPAMVGATLVALLATFLIQPALFAAWGNHYKWQASEWLTPLHDLLFDNNMWRSARGLLMALAIPLLVLGLWLHPAAPQPLALKDMSNAQVNLLVHSPEEAIAAIAKLKDETDAGAIRWLGAFLPADVEAKQLVLTQLKDAFPKIQPQQPSNLDDLQQQMDTLKESLGNIAAAQGARPELKAAADDLRRSLELFTSTGTEKELLHFENRLFGSFNKLGALADQLSTLEPPEIKNLDPALRAMFQAGNGDLRIEVTPQKGINSLSLARELDQRGFSVAHPAVGKLNNSEQFWRSLCVSGWVGLGLLLLSLAATIRNVAGILAAIMVTTIALAGGLAIFLQFQLLLEPDTLLLGTCGITLLLLMILDSFTKTPITAHPVHPAQHAAEGWALTALLGAGAAPVIVLDLHPWSDRVDVLLALMFMITAVVGLYLVPLVRTLRRDDLA